MKKDPLRIFISYRRIHNGSPCAFIIAERLMALGIEVFYDNKTLHDYNSNYKRKIFSEIDASDYVLVLLQNGCMTEKKDDVYLAEIRYAIEHLGIDRLMTLPIDEDFDWGKENIPKDLDDRKIKEHNNLSPMRLDNLDQLTKNILARCTAKEEYRHYLMFSEQRLAAKKMGGIAIMQKTDDIYNLPLDQRWHMATRVSVLSIGCGYLTGRMAPVIARKYAEGVSFRLISVDPSGESASDTIKTKLNNFMPELESEYLQHCETKVRQLFEHITRICDSSPNQVEYKITNHHLTCTIHIVEHENSALDYIFVEFLPIWATGENQLENRAILVYRHDPTYDYYMKQFEKIWISSRVIYRKELGGI